MSNTKQVIVWRADLKVRTGKKMAQAGHSVLAFLTRRLELTTDKNGKTKASCYLSPAEVEWLNSSYAKITLQVENEAELLEIYEKAKAAGIEAHKVIDSGKTEFNGVPTLTCICIGADYADKIDKITGHLKLY